MTDNKSMTGGQDRKRINVHQAYEVRDWSKKFGVSEEELVAAVGAVGDQAVDVEAHLTDAIRRREALKRAAP